MALSFFSEQMNWLLHVLLMRVITFYPLCHICPLSDWQCSCLCSLPSPPWEMSTPTWLASSTSPNMSTSVSCWVSTGHLPVSEDTLVIFLCYFLVIYVLLFLVVCVCASVCVCVCVRSNTVRWQIHCPWMLITLGCLVPTVASTVLLTVSSLAWLWTEGSFWFSPRGQGECWPHRLCVKEFSVLFIFGDWEKKSVKSLMLIRILQWSSLVLDFLLCLQGS